MGLYTSQDKVNDAGGNEFPMQLGLYICFACVSFFVSTSLKLTALSQATLDAFLPCFFLLLSTLLFEAALSEGKVQGKLTWSVAAVENRANRVIIWRCPQRGAVGREGIIFREGGEGRQGGQGTAGGRELGRQGREGGKGRAGEGRAKDGWAEGWGGRGGKGRGGEGGSRGWQGEKGRRREQWGETRRGGDGGG